MLLLLLISLSCRAADTVCVRATHVLVDSNFKPDHVVISREGIIEQVRPWNESLRNYCKSLTEEQGLLTPGLVDIHIHGAGGQDVMDADNHPEALQIIASTLLKEGVTTWLPTTTSAPPDKLSKVLANVAQHAKKQSHNEARIAGIHMEGPFISQTKSGCHPHHSIIPVSLGLQSQWMEDSQNTIRIVTFAPELELSHHLIKWCRENKVIPSIGHTNAGEIDVISAIEKGAGMGTHLFNAMSQTKSRDAGAAMGILEHPSVPFEMILDGIHLSEPLVRIAWQLSRRNPERFILITDAIRAKGLTDSNGIFQLGDGIRVRVSGLRASLVDNPNTLAGSVLTLPHAIKNMQRITGCSLAEAFVAATYNPAKAINMHHTVGRLAPGLCADMVLFSNTHSLSVKSAWRNGTVITPI